ALDLLKKFSQNAARSIHAAHLCLRASRETAGEERAHLARELHDGPIQSLLGVELRLEAVKRRADFPPGIKENIDELQDIIRREAKSLRNLVNDSRRKALRPERLLEFLSDLLERFQRDSGVVTRFFADLDNDPMPPRICHEIARMAEEGITNVRKHSKASALTVRIGSVGNNWVLVMVDDGIGFEFHGVWSLEKLMSSGLGPRVMKERVQSLRGKLMIESTPTGARIGTGVKFKTIILGADIQRADELNAILLGASGIVRKYAASETLFKSIRAVTAGEIWIKREVIDDLIQMMPGRDASATNPLIH